MEGRTAPPPAAELLGFKLVEIDPDAGTIEVGFTATEQFLNPAGTVQGGFLAAMLDDTLGPRWSRRSAMASGRRRPTCTSNSSGPLLPASCAATAGSCGVAGMSRSWRASFATARERLSPPRPLPRRSAGPPHRTSLSSP
jgi:hypothetical protein